MEKPDIIQTIEQAGIELKKNKSLCPFHSERTPSFVVNPQRQTFHCWGCGEHGDVITFVRKFYNLSFRDACKYLHLNQPIRINSEQQKRRSLVKAFREWEKSLKKELTDYYRDFHAITRDLKTMDEAEDFSEDFHLMPIVEVYLDILMNGADEEKYNLYRKVNGNGKF